MDFRETFTFQEVLSRTSSVIRTTQYSALYFAMCFGDMALTVVALCTLYTKTGQLAAEHVARSAARKNLRHLLMFSIAPGLIQILCAIRQVTNIVVSYDYEPDG